MFVIASVGRQVMSPADVKMSSEGSEHSASPKDY